MFWACGTGKRSWFIFPLSNTGVEQLPNLKNVIYVSKRCRYVLYLHFCGYYGKYNNLNNWPLYLDLTTEILNACKLKQTSSSGSIEPRQPDVLGYYVRETATILLHVERLCLWAELHSMMLLLLPHPDDIQHGPVSCSTSFPRMWARVWEVGEKFTKSHNRIGKDKYHSLNRFDPARGSGCVCSNLPRDFNMLKIQMQGERMLVLVPKICITWVLVLHHKNGEKI